MSSSAQSAQSHAAPRSLRTSSLSEGVLILLALTIVQRLVGFARGIYFCRSLDAEQLGQWDLALSFLMLAAPLAVFALPGSFGRYAESYRTAGQLRTFLRRTTLVSVVPALLFCTSAAVFAPHVADFIFAGPDEATLVRAMAVSLAGLITFNFLTCLFTALKAGRLVSYMQFTNTLLFAVVSFALMAGWRSDAVSGVVAFGVGCFVSSAAALVWMVRLWRELPESTIPLPHGTLWAKLMPFAFWLWVTNWVANSFEMADRYMIVHFSDLAPGAALDLVGQYHSARIIPALMLGLADMLSTWITPHLINDWETGDRAAVSRRLSFILKSFTLVFVGGSVVLVVGAPLFFHTALADKFGFGQEIFPWALACAIWTGLAMISNNWLWCAERSRQVVIGLALGLVLNIGLNLWLLPRYGLTGVVIAAAAAKCLSLAVLWLQCGWLEMRIDRGLILAGLFPALLLLGPWWASAILVVVAVGAIPAVSLFTSEEKAQIAAGAQRVLERFVRSAARRASQAQ